MVRSLWAILPIQTSGFFTAVRSYSEVSVTLLPKKLLDSIGALEIRGA